MRIGFLFFAFLFLSFLSAHEGHSHKLTEEIAFVNVESFLHWIGTYHLIFLHFPIALITMTVVAELLFYCFKKPVYDQAAYFMIMTAAIWAIPTALLGYALSYNITFHDTALDLFEWHRYFGSVTALLAFITAYFRYAYANQQSTSLKSYYISLLCLFIFVILTALFGGDLAFGV